jgi:hypothetical protein
MRNVLPIVPIWSSWETASPSSPLGARGECDSHRPHLEPVGNALPIGPIWSRWRTLFPLAPNGARGERRPLGPHLGLVGTVPVAERTEAGSPEPDLVQPSKIAGGHLGPNPVTSRPPCIASRCPSWSWTAPSPDLPQTAGGPVDRLSACYTAACVKIGRLMALAARQG